MTERSRFVRCASPVQYYSLHEEKMNSARLCTKLALGGVAL